MTLRLFCALPVPPAVQDELITRSKTLRSALCGASISWTKPGNFHLTLSFLGDVDGNRVDELAARLLAASQQSPTFEARSQGLGCFPNPSRPRVIWAGVQSPATELAHLQTRIAQACAPFAERQEKGHFSGHITLGRIRSLTNPAKVELANELAHARDQLFGRWPVDHIDLISSDLSQGAPRYTTLHRFNLSTP